jgi:glycosyltransferase involved in cell wall biosynthesis
MKIAMFTDYFYPEIGGIQDSIAITSRELGRRGHEVTIYAPRYGARDYRLVEAACGERDLGPNVRVRRRLSLPFPSSTRQSRAALPSLAGCADLRFFRRPDIIHTHSFFGIGLEALLNAAVLRKPVIGTNHTTIAGFAGHMPVSVARAGAYVSWFHNRCDVVTAPSKSVFDELGRENLRRPLEIVSNPIDTDLFVSVSSNAEAAAIRQRFGLHGPTITYAGRLAPEKNIGVVLHALAQLRDKNMTAHLAIAGHGSHESILRQMAVELRIVDQVKFLGTLPQPALAQLFQISDTFAIMSTSETQSMVLLQAMAAGVPVVAANSRALPEFVGPDNGMLIDPDDSAQLASALHALLAEPARRRSLGAGGRARALQHGIAPVTDAWERIYATTAAARLAA